MLLKKVYDLDPGLRRDDGKKILRSFKPVVDDRSKVLILGSMPGPEALRKQQYYGFEGNHFWTLIPGMFGKDKPVQYEDRIKLVKQKGIALWDVLETCIRPTAMDSRIKNPKPNRIPELLAAHPGIQAVFVNGRTAHKIFMKNFTSQINEPVYYMPSTSPAHAAMTLDEKLKKWALIKNYLKNKCVRHPGESRDLGRKHAFKEGLGPGFRLSPE